MRMTRNGEEIASLLPLPELLSKLTHLATADEPEEVDHAFWAEDHRLVWACRDGMEALMYLARHEQIGWELNAGSRCDVPFDQFSVSVCDNKNGRNCQFDELRALTPQGALAAGILAVLQAREAAKA